MPIHKTFWGGYKNPTIYSIYKYKCYIYLGIIWSGVQSLFFYYEEKFLRIKDTEKNKK